MLETRRPRVLLQSLGCKTNQYENDALAAAFLAEGFLPAEPHHAVDVAVLNTCTVTGEAGRKSLQMLRRLRHHYPDAIVVAAGCHAQLTDLSGLADITVGTAGRAQIVQEVIKKLDDRMTQPVSILDRFDYETIAPVSIPSETRAYIKIQDGCDNKCTYCAIRLARGPARSREPEAVVQEVRTLAAAGYREFILTGTHMGSYGKREGYELIDLIETLDAMAVGRIRISSLEPVTLSDAFIERAAKCESLCPHFHLSLQSGSDRTLQRMARRYDTVMYEAAVRRMLEVWPNVGLTTDIIVGFPGETEEDHQETLAFLNRLPFTDLHVFRFSRRANTPADTMPDQVPGDVSKRRSRDVEAIARIKREVAIAKRIGQKRTIIVEKHEDDAAYGYTEDYVYTKVMNAGHDVSIGQVLPIRITGQEDARALAQNDLYL